MHKKLIEPDVDPWPDRLHHVEREGIAIRLIRVHETDSWIEADIRAQLETSIQQAGTRATARRLGIDRDTIQTWTANADRIPLDRAIPAVVSAHPQLDLLKAGFSSGKDK